MIEPKTYRKKPVHVQAMRFTGANSNDVARFVGEEDDGIPYSETCDYFEIEALEGTMRADVGDYVIQGIVGEFYPCKPDIFKASYEEVDQDGQRVNSTQYPESANTPVMTVAAVLEWLEGEKKDIEANQKKMSAELGKLPSKYADKINDQLTGSISAIEVLIEKLTHSTFEQLDEAHGNE